MLLCLQSKKRKCQKSRHLFARTPSTSVMINIPCGQNKSKILYIQRKAKYIICITTSFQRKTKISFYKHLHCGRKKKVSYYICFRQKQVSNYIPLLEKQKCQFSPKSILIKDVLWQGTHLKTKCRRKLPSEEGEKGSRGHRKQNTFDGHAIADEITLSFLNF